MILPNTSGLEDPNPDLADDIKPDYEEARAIANQSPRGAAALLRLALQKLCKELGGKGKNINDDIAYLVKEKRLDPSIQQALDILRVTGNNAVHPGELDLQDNRSTVLALFSLINEVVEELISKPKRIEEIYAQLPSSTLAAIAKRDGSHG